MAVTICHASIDEKGKARGGAAGDQTGKEVCTRSWYNKPWGVMLRYSDSNIAIKAAEIATKLANSNLVGYDQDGRNTLYKALEKYGWDVDRYINSKSKTEADCSSFVYCCYCVLIPQMRSSSNAPTTSTMKNFMTKYGFKAYTTNDYLTTDKNVKRGDLLCKPGSHIVMVVSDGANVAPTPAPAPAPKPEAPKTFTGVVNAYMLNVRRGPGASYTIARVVKNGQVLTFEKESDGWGKLINEDCWVSMKYITKK